MRHSRPAWFGRRAISGLEYALLIGLIGIAGLVAIAASGRSVDTLLTGVSNRLGNAAGHPVGGQLDQTPPQASAISLAGSQSGNLTPGNHLILRVVFSEPVVISGSPSLAVALDALSGQTAPVLYQENSTTVLFRYDIPTGQPSYAAFSVTALQSGISDLAGNPAISSVPGFALGGSFACQTPSGIVYDYSAPGAYTWTTPCGVSFVEVEIWGAGSGGAAGGGGGGGGKCATGGTNATSGATAGTQTPDGGNSLVTKASVALRAAGGQGADRGRSGGGGATGSTTDGGPGGGGQGGFGNTASANFIDGSLGVTVLTNATSNSGSDAVSGSAGSGFSPGAGGAGGSGGGAIASARGSGIVTGKGGNGGNGGSGGTGGGPNGSNKYGGGGGGGGGGEGGGGGGYLWVRDLPAGTSLALTVGAGSTAQGTQAGGTQGINGGPPCDGQQGGVGIGGENGQNGRIRLYPQ